MITISIVQSVLVGRFCRYLSALRPAYQPAPSLTHPRFVHAMSKNIQKCNNITKSTAIYYVAVNEHTYVKRVRRLVCVLVGFNIFLNNCYVSNMYFTSQHLNAEHIVHFRYVHTLLCGKLHIWRILHNVCLVKTTSMSFACT